MHGDGLLGGWGAPEGKSRCTGLKSARPFEAGQRPIGRPSFRIARGKGSSPTPGLRRSPRTPVSLAPMGAPITLPSEYGARSDHRAADVAGAGRVAPGSGSVTSGSANRYAAQRWPFDQQVPFACRSGHFAEQGGESVSGRQCSCMRAWVARTAAAIDLTCGDSC